MRLPFKGLRIVISLSAILIALTHTLFPKLAIDAIAVFCLVIAILPWLAPVIKSIELPGGFKIELQALEKAKDEVEKAGLLSAATKNDRELYSFQKITGEDPNLSLAGLRIEIEKRLIDLGNAAGISTKRQGIAQLMRTLEDKGVLRNEEYPALTGMINILK